MDKKDVVHIFNGILESYKDEWNDAICSNMDRTRYYHASEMSQRQKDKYHMIWLTCGI